MYFCIQELFWDSDRKSRQLRLIFDIKKFYPKYQELLWSEWCSFVPIKEWETFWNICVWFTKCNFFTSMNGIQPFPHLESKTPESKGKFWLNLFSPFLSVLELSICSKIAEKLENQNQIIFWKINNRYTVRYLFLQLASCFLGENLVWTSTHILLSPDAIL